MEIILKFLLMALTAITVENAIFARGFGIIRTSNFSYKPRSLVAFSVAITDLTLMTCLFSWCVSWLTKEYYPDSPIIYFKPVSFLLCAILSYVIYCPFAAKLLPKYYEEFKGLLPFAAFNCTVLGAALISSNQDFSLAGWLGFGLGIGLGYSLASFIILAGRSRIHLSDVPKAFRGLPIMLLYIGLISLAIYGLAGHQLPI